MRYVRVLVRVAGNPELARVLLAFVGFNMAEWGVWIAMLVYAYGHGGATTSAVVAVAQLVPAALFAPIAGSLGDRHRPTQVLAAGYLAQGAAMGATAAVLLLHGSPYAAYALAAAAATAVTITRPAQAGLLPALSRTPDELTAANVAAGWLGSISVLGGPALAGILLGAGGAGVVFAVFAAAVLASAALVAPVAGPRACASPDAATGLRAAAADPGPRALVWLLGVEAFAIGALDVLYVVLAVGVLKQGGSSAGYVNAAFGAGGVVGIGATVVLIGRRRLAPALLAGLALWASALAGIGFAPTIAAAFALFVAAGVGRTVVDVAGSTLLQRISPPDALARVFGLLEGVSMVGLAGGSLAAAGFVALAGGRGAFVCLAIVLPLAALLVLRRLLAADSAVLPVVEIARLRALPLFAPLGAATLEGLARALEPLEAAAGTAIVREGEPGERFYVVAEGELDVSVGGASVATLSRGDCFGEIALLRDVPRTATVTAVGAVRLDVLEKETFLAAVCGFAPSERAADELVQGRLERATIVP